MYVLCVCLSCFLIINISLYWFYSYPLSGRPTYTTPRRWRRSQFVSTVGRQTIRSQSGSSGSSSHALGAGNQARRAKEPGQKTRIHWSSLEWYGYTFIGTEERRISPGSGLFYSGLDARLSIPLADRLWRNQISRNAHCNLQVSLPQILRFNSISSRGKDNCT